MDICAPFLDEKMKTSNTRYQVCENVCSDDSPFELFHENAFRTLSTNFDNNAHIAQVDQAFALLEQCFIENNVLNEDGDSRYSLRTSVNNLLSFREVDDNYDDFITSFQNCKIKTRKKKKHLLKRKIDLKAFKEDIFDVESMLKNKNDLMSENESELESDTDSKLDDLSDFENTLTGIDNINEIYELSDIEEGTTEISNVESNETNSSNIGLEDNIKDLRVHLEKLKVDNSQFVNINSFCSNNKCVQHRKKTQQVARKKTYGITQKFNLSKEQKVIKELSSKDGDFVPSVFDKMTRSAKRDLERVLVESTANLVIQKTTQLISEKIKSFASISNEKEFCSDSSEDEVSEPDISKAAEIVTNTILECIKKSKGKKCEKSLKDLKNEIFCKLNLSSESESENTNSSEKNDHHAMSNSDKSNRYNSLKNNKINQKNNQLNEVKNKVNDISNRKKIEIRKSSSLSEKQSASPLEYTEDTSEASNSFQETLSSRSRNKSDQNMKDVKSNIVSTRKKAIKNEAGEVEVDNSPLKKKGNVIARSCWEDVEYDSTKNSEINHSKVENNKFKRNLRSSKSGVNESYFSALNSEEDLSDDNDSISRNKQENSVAINRNHRLTFRKRRSLRIRNLSDLERHIDKEYFTDNLILKASADSTTDDNKILKLKEKSILSNSLGGGADIVKAIEGRADSASEMKGKTYFGENYKDKFIDSSKHGTIDITASDYLDEQLTNNKPIEVKDVTCPSENIASESQSKEVNQSNKDHGAPSNVDFFEQEKVRGQDDVHSTQEIDFVDQEDCTKISSKQDSLEQKSEERNQLINFKSGKDKCINKTNLNLMSAINGVNQIINSEENSTTHKLLNSKENVTTDVDTDISGKSTASINESDEYTDTTKTSEFEEKDDQFTKISNDVIVNKNQLNSVSSMSSTEHSNETKSKKYERTVEALNEKENDPTNKSNNVFCNPTISYNENCRDRNRSEEVIQLIKSNNTIEEISDNIHLSLMMSPIASVKCESKIQSLENNLANEVLRDRNNSGMICNEVPCHAATIDNKRPSESGDKTKELDAIKSTESLKNKDICLEKGCENISPKQDKQKLDNEKMLDELSLKENSLLENIAIHHTINHDKSELQTTHIKPYLVSANEVDVDIRNEDNVISVCNTRKPKELKETKEQNLKSEAIMFQQNEMKGFVKIKENSMNESISSDESDNVCNNINENQNTSSYDNLNQTILETSDKQSSIKICKNKTKNTSINKNEADELNSGQVSCNISTNQDNNLMVKNRGNNIKHNNKSVTTNQTSCSTSIKKNPEETTKLKETESNLSESNEITEIQKHLEDIKNINFDVLCNKTKNKKLSSKPKNNEVIIDELTKILDEDFEETHLQSTDAILTDNKDVLNKTKSNSSPKMTNEEKLVHLSLRDPRLSGDKKMINVLTRDPRFKNKMIKDLESPDAPPAKAAKMLESKKNPDAPLIKSPPKVQVCKNVGDLSPKKSTKMEESKKIPDAHKMLASEILSDLKSKDLIDSQENDSSKKKKEKPVDKEFLYKTPLSDLHSTSTENLSYQRTIKKNQILKVAKDKEWKPSDKDTKIQQFGIPKKEFIDKVEVNQSCTSTFNKLVEKQKFLLNHSKRNEQVSTTFQKSISNHDIDNPEHIYSRREYQRRDKYVYDHYHSSSSSFKGKDYNNYIPEFTRTSSVFSSSAYSVVPALPEPMYNQNEDFDQSLTNMETSLSPPFCPPPPSIRSPTPERRRRWDDSPDRKSLSPDDYYYGQHSSDRYRERSREWKRSKEINRRFDESPPKKMSYFDRYSRKRSPLHYSRRLGSVSPPPYYRHKEHSSAYRDYDRYS